jgi:glycoprotein 3-alpha-L-fucosyltransferase
MENWKFLESHFSKFDILASTSPSSQIYTNYFWYGGPFRLLKLPRKKIRKSMAAAYISNCKVVSSGRMEIIEELRKHGVTIDTYGSCGANSFEPKSLMDIPRNQRKIENLAYYKFYLAFENSKDPGYITEKYWEALTAGTVPIYLGAPDIKLYQPSPNSILFVDDFKSIKDLADRIIYLSNNPKEYSKMLEWKEKGPQDSFLAVTDYQAYDIWCKICHTVADKYQTPTHNRALLVRERNTFRYRPVYLINKTYQELVVALQSVYKGYTPRWTHLRAGHVRFCSIKSSG